MQSSLFEYLLYRTVSLVCLRIDNASSMLFPSDCRIVEAWSEGSSLNVEHVDELAAHTSFSCEDESKRSVYLRKG